MTTHSLSESRYRCAECGHGEHLFAWAEGLLEGPLGADGLLTSHDYAEDTMVCESSIRCDVHGDTVTIHKFDGAAWCGWVLCERCEHGRVRDRWGSMTAMCPECWGACGAWKPITVAASV